MRGRGGKDHLFGRKSEACVIVTMVTGIQMDKNMFIIVIRIQMKGKIFNQKINS